VNGYYAGRVECYLTHALLAGGSAAAVNQTSYFACLDNLARDFQADSVDASSGTPAARSICLEPEGDATAISLLFIEKYRASVEAL